MLLCPMSVAVWFSASSLPVPRSALCVGDHQYLNTSLVLTKEEVVRVAVEKGFAERLRSSWEQIGILTNVVENCAQFLQETRRRGKTPLLIPVEGCVYFCFRLNVEVKRGHSTFSASNSSVKTGVNLLPWNGLRVAGIYLCGPAQCLRFPGRVKLIAICSKQ